MKPDLSKLKELIKKHDEERWRLSKIIKDIEETPKIKALVGKCFKYRNSYNANDSWWLYWHIKGHKEDTLVTDYFEEDTRNKIEFVFNRIEYGMSFFSNPNYIEITKKEYDAAAKKVLKKIRKHFKLNKGSI